MLCPSCTAQNSDDATRCVECGASLLPFATEISTGPDPFYETNDRKAEGSVGTIFNLIASWIEGLKMRREIRKTLGRKAADTDLSSVDTWMKVRDEEQKR